MHRIRARSWPTRSAAWLCALAACAPAARARAEPDDSSAQAAGLFVQACVLHPGAASSLRQWAVENKIQPLSAEGQMAFLHGLPGIVYDATMTGGKFVIVSEDTGACSIVAEHAEPKALGHALEDDIKHLGADIKLDAERDDTRAADLHHRQYTVSHGSKAFSVLVSTTPDNGEAMLSVTAP